MFVQKAERDESFQIELFDADGGATLGKLTKCIITIVNDEGETVSRRDTLVPVTWMPLVSKPKTSKVGSIVTRAVFLKPVVCSQQAS